MPDLAEAAILNWIDAVRPLPERHDWPPILRAVERAPDIAPACEGLGAALDRAIAADALALSAALRAAPLREDLAAALAQFGAGRLLRLLHWLAEVDLPECGAAIAALMGTGDAAGRALQAAASALTRQATLRSILHPDRIAALRAALEETRP